MIKGFLSVSAAADIGGGLALYEECVLVSYYSRKCLRCCVIDLGQGNTWNYAMMV